MANLMLPIQPLDDAAIDGPQQIASVHAVDVFCDTFVVWVRHPLHEVEAPAQGHVQQSNAAIGGVHRADEV